LMSSRCQESSPSTQEDIKIEFFIWDCDIRIKQLSINAYLNQLFMAVLTPRY
jgi:hypothetical protein